MIEVILCWIFNCCDYLFNCGIYLCMYEPIIVIGKQCTNVSRILTLNNAQNFLFHSEMCETLAEASQICVMKHFC